MRRHGLLRRFLRDEAGQDVTEYVLTVAFVALASTAIFIGAGGDVNTMWTSAFAALNGTPSTGAPAASSTTSPDTSTGRGGRDGGRDGGHGGG